MSKATVKKTPHGSSYRTSMGKQPAGASGICKLHKGGKTRETFNAERMDKLEKQAGGPKGAVPAAK